MNFMIILTLAILIQPDTPFGEEVGDANALPGCITSILKRCKTMFLFKILINIIYILCVPKR